MRRRSEDCGRRRRITSRRKALAADERLTAGPFRSTYESLKAYTCPQWYQDAKFGIWAHWGPQGVPEQGDWYARNMYVEGSGTYEHHLEHYGHPSRFGFKDVIQLWKAEKFDPDRLIALYKRAVHQVLRFDGLPPRQFRPLEVEVSSLERREHGPAQGHRRTLAGGGAEARAAVWRLRAHGAELQVVLRRASRRQGRPVGRRAL